MDGLRGVAIAVVLIAHAQATASPTGYSGWLSPFRLFSNGNYGVQIFFVLSGYLITSILLREFDATGKIDMKMFYCRRILRIFPAFYLFLLFIIGLNVTGNMHLPTKDLAFGAAHLINYAQAITLLFNLPNVDSPDYAFIGHLWSLSMEEQFYWVWPVLLLLLLRTRWYGLLLALILFMPVSRLLTYFLCPGLRGQVVMMLHTGSDPIFSGCLLAVCMSRFPDLCKKMLLPSWAVAGLGLYVFVVDPYLNDHMPRGFNIVLGMTLVIAAMTVGLGNILLQEKATWYHWLLNTKPLIYLGRISYSVYLWQELYFRGNTTFLGKYPLNIFAAIATGAISFFLVEVPFVRLKDKYFHAPSKRPTPVAIAAK